MNPEITHWKTITADVVACNGDAVCVARVLERFDPIGTGACSCEESSKALPPLPTPEEAARIELADFTARLKKAMAGLKPTPLRSLPPLVALDPRAESLATLERLCRDALAEATARPGRPNPLRGVPRR